MHCTHRAYDDKRNHDFLVQGSPLCLTGAGLQQQHKNTRPTKPPICRLLIETVQHHYEESESYTRTVVLVLTEYFH